jgi:colicin import membrane protein
MASIKSRADRSIVKRQQEELKYEALVAGGVDTFKVNCKAFWENRTEDVIRDNRLKTKAGIIEANQRASLQERRQKLAAMLSFEQKSYEQELVECEETPTQRMDKMAVRAYELKKRREDERKAFVQEKLYQQWRDGIDDLRTMDCEIVQLKTIAGRDHQLFEKDIARQENDEHERVFAQLWHEGYLAKIEREEREKELRAERREEQKGILKFQLDMKAERLEQDKAEEDVENGELKVLWQQQIQEEKDAVVIAKVNAKAERQKADEYAEIQRVQREEEIELEKAQDKAFVANVLTKERLLSEKEAADKEQAKQKSREFNEALKIEMARKAASEEELIRLQNEESERQFQKRYQQWEKEEVARRDLMTEVYHDRAEQVRLKQDMRDHLKQEVGLDRERIDLEVERLNSIEAEREVGEDLVNKRHQEELFRQMDYHQVQRHRELQQHAIEQRQAAIREEKIRRAVAVEKGKAHGIMQGVIDGRNANKAAKTGVVPPWEK